MAERSTELAAFLETAGCDLPSRRPLAGDASNRKYERLERDGQSVVLMDAPPEKGEDVRPFVAIARHLSSIGLSPPHVLAADEQNGFLLLEDLGDDLYSRIVTRDPKAERPLYLAAVDALVALHEAKVPEAPDYGPATMAQMAGLATSWYAFGAHGAPQEEQTTELIAAMRSSLNALAPWSPVLVLRDYHAENLIWLPEREGAARVGLLDFQDAAIGHPAYDLMSLARDARRDVSPETREAMIDYYAARTAQDKDAFALACATVSAQRNLRILGVFARLSLHFGKAHYVDLIPRVWANLAADLRHTGLARLADTVFSHLPEPTTETLTTLKAKCGTIPTL